MIRYLFLFLLFSFLKLGASNYLPKVICYDKEAYNAGRQNWDVEIDKHGVVYFGNSDGLLYNVYGEWGLATLSEKGLVRAVLADNDSIWCGSSEYGFFTKKDGEFIYHQVGKTKGEPIWNIESYKNQIILQSTFQLFIYDKANQKVNTIDTKDRIYSIIDWEDKIWVVLASGKIGYLSQGKVNTVSQFKQLENREVRNSFIHNESLFFVLFDGDVYTYNGTDLIQVKLPKILDNKTLFTGISYNNNSYCLGSISNGFLHIDDEGNVLRHVNSGDGLIDNTVLSMQCDELGNIWLGLDYGIAKIELQSAINNIFEGGATYSIKDFQDKTYLATNKGLFMSEKEEGFQAVPNTSGQVWKLKEIDNELYVCHNNGLFLLKGGIVQNIAPYSGFIDVAHFEGSDYFLFSGYHGIILVKKVGSRYDYISNLNIWGNSSLVYDKLNKCIWGEMNGQNIIKFTLDSNYKVKSGRIDSVTKIFPTKTGIYFNNGQHLLQYKDGAFFNSENPLFAKVSAENIEALNFSKNGNAMAYIQNEEVKLDVLLPDGNIYSYNTLLKSLGKLINNDRKYVDIEENKLRLATDRGVTVFDIDYHSDFKTFSLPVVSSVTEVNNKTQKKYFPFPAKGLKYKAGNKDLKFRFSIHKSKHDVVEYRYRLLPHNNHWSEWSSSIDEAFYAQLKGGNYHFFLQAKINGGELKETSLYLGIDKWWYQTYWVIIPVFLVVVLIWLTMYYVMLNINKIKLKKQEKVFAQSEAKKTLSLKNEQLLQYTEIISHKNEFLNKLKLGLEAMRNAEAKRWANMINDEVNNEKKEFLFHKLFSEIHQDFIARLTEKYPSLTSNDIRILSFIRANLGNKEISNLMNISPRSLDTNRYRLRKKLNLEQGSDLNQFIRDF